VIIATVIAHVTGHAMAPVNHLHWVANRLMDLAVDGHDE
jgi:hypothetical protein